jgi:hypothetical protein
VGDELEVNLLALQEEAVDCHLDAPTLYKRIMTHKTAKEWKKAERVRALGYTKNSSHTKERRRKEAREHEVFQQGAKAL